MAQDMSLDVATNVTHINGSGIRKVHREILDTIDYSKRLILDKPEDIEIVRALMLKPPLHSVVAWIDPCVAKLILKHYNDGNRPISDSSVDYLVQEHLDGNFTLTGDTLKFCKDRIIDGQYRLTASVKVDRGFETHMVFGLDEAVFDILDRQRTRTPGDILSIAGCKNANMMGSAVRWVTMIDEGKRGMISRGLNNREIKRLALGPYKDINRYAGLAEEIRSAYGIPSSMTAALLFLIGRGSSRQLAEQFASEWVAGNRNFNRNKAFDVFALRVKKIEQENHGSAVNRHVLAAMMVQTFNYYHAAVVPSGKGIYWNKNNRFPKLAFDPLAFRRERDSKQAADTSLPATQDKMLKIMAELRDKEGNVEHPYHVFAAKTGIPLRQIGYVIKTMQELNLLHLSRKAHVGEDGYGKPAVWRLKEEGELRLKRVTA